MRGGGGVNGRKSEESDFLKISFGRGEAREY